MIIKEHMCPTRTFAIAMFTFIAILICSIVTVMILAKAPHNHAWRCGGKTSCTRPYIVCLRAHISDAMTCFNAYKLISEFGQGRVLLLFDNTKGAFENSELQRIFSPGQVIIVTEDSSKKMHSFHKSQWSTVESAFVSIYLHAKKNMPECVPWEDIWIVESDVYCDGHYGTIFNTCASERNEDLVAVRNIVPESNHEGKDDWWWNHLEGKIAEVSLKERVGIFLCVMRASRAYFEALSTTMNQSSGFCEVFLPTVAKVNNLMQGWIPERFIGNVWPAKVSGLYNLPRIGDAKLYHKATC